jgi:hypothetical protein
MSVVSCVVLSSTVVCSAALAARLDFTDPKRAVGREDNVRVDAQLADDNVSSSTALNVTYQIENLGTSTIAVADKVSSADYDTESQTIIVSLGAEVPTGTAMPHLSIVRPGEKRVFIAGAVPHIMMPSVRTPFTVLPRFVQIKVTVLRDMISFAGLIERQAANAPAPVLSNDMFDRWVEGSDSVFLNAIPIRWRVDNRGMNAESNRPAVGGTF